jgi:flagellar biogenesis protein FliO
MRLRGGPIDPIGRGTNMKFIRNARTHRLKERAFDLLTKALLIAFSTLVCLWMVSGAHAGSNSITGIKASPQADGSYAIDFELSQKVKPEQVEVEFERNFIQVSLRGVSAYPARTENINQAALEKVFTYQYQPDLSRARILLKSAASAIKGKTGWELTDKGVRVTVKGQGAAAVAEAATTDTVKAKSSSASAYPAETDEERIVQEILSEVKPAGKAAEAAIAAEQKKAVTASSEEQPLFAAKTASQSAVKEKDTGAARVFASLLLVLGIIGATAVAYRRFALGKGISFQKQGRVIEVISTQGLGPKRSVALIKVLDQYMVVGMAGEGMSLLANLGSDVKIDKFIDQAGPGASFTDAFETALSGDSGIEKATGSGAVAAQKPTLGMGLGIRSAIKKRIEGYKPL